MDLSIIIVSWNARDYLVKCLRSLEPALRGIKSEVIVVDNASADGSAEAVREIFPEAVLIENTENLGFARANNIGIKRSDGRYVCLVNSDISVLEGCVARMFSYMEAHPDIGLLGPGILNADRTIQRSCTRFPTLRGALLTALGADTVFSSLRYFSHTRIEDVDVLSGCFMMARRKALEEVGLLDERFFIYAEDKDWCRRFHDSGWRAVYFPHAQAVHYGGGSSANTPVRFYIEMHRANLQYWEKHRGRTARALYPAIILLHQSIRLARGCALYLVRPARKEDTMRKIKRSGACIKWMLSGKRGITPEGV